MYVVRIVCTILLLVIGVLSCYGMFWAICESEKDSNEGLGSTAFTFFAISITEFLAVVLLWH